MRWEPFRCGALQAPDRTSSGWREPPRRFLLARGKIVVAKDGIEPPTQGFSVLCSTN